MAKGCIVAWVLPLRCFLFLLHNYLHVYAIMMHQLTYLDKREVLQQEYSQPSILHSPRFWWVVTPISFPFLLCCNPYYCYPSRYQWQYSSWYTIALNWSNINIFSHTISIMPFIDMLPATFIIRDHNAARFTTGILGEAFMGSICFLRSILTCLVWQMLAPL